MNAKEIFRERPQKPLYHYTTQVGLLGIIENKEIWATHTQYLNDNREFKQAIDILREILAEMRKESEYEEHVERLDSMAEALKKNDIQAANVCVASCSQHRDQLSQWRAYSNGAGFSIGFSAEFLLRIADPLIKLGSVFINKTLWLVPCVYQTEKQRALMRTLVDDLIKQSIRYPDRTPGLASRLVNMLTRYAPILKDHSFDEENEWRFITAVKSDEELSYRPGKSMIIPFFKIPLRNKKLPFAIESITVGPTPHKTEARRSVQSLVRHYSFPPEVKVLSSKVHCRNW